MATPPLPAPGTTVTPPERYVLAGIARGHSNAQIAADLHLSINTVKHHIKRAAARLGCPSNRVQVVAAGYRTGILANLTAEPCHHRPLCETDLAVLARIADGHSDAEIGQELFPSESAAKAHIRRLFRQMRATGRPHAVALAVQHGHLLIATTQPTTVGAAA